MNVQTPTKPNDAWIYAQQLVEKCLSSLPLQETLPVTVGKFKYSIDSSSRTIRLLSGAEIDSLIAFNLVGTKSPKDLAELAYWKKGIRHSLSPYRIKEENQEGHTYPSFWYNWGGRTNVEKGKLIFLKVDLAGDTFVNYYAPQFKAQKRGQETLLEKLPDSLIGVEEVLGKEVPWSIDYDKRSWEILNNTGLEEFVEELTKRK